MKKLEEAAEQLFERGAGLASRSWWASWGARENCFLESLEIHSASGPMIRFW
ncbi:MAG TPA: hypothetical protein VHZ25_12090 [Acidobacteriaceae bacterium]|jgi:hypothetical protein|nr:hypothetical protein [Acidobacteriaceae bacterium]